LRLCDMWISSLWVRSADSCPTTFLSMHNMWAILTFDSVILLYYVEYFTSISILPDSFLLSAYYIACISVSVNSFIVYRARCNVLYACICTYFLTRTDILLVLSKENIHNNNNNGIRYVLINFIYTNSTEKRFSCHVI